MAVDVIRTKGPFLGVFLVSGATLMYEVLLTRIFSVTLWYHYAFVVISIALFGITVGANLIYLFPEYFTSIRSKYHLSLYSFAFSVAMVFSFLSFLCIPFIDPKESTIVDYFSIILIFLIVSIPFVFSGICLCLALTRFPTQLSGLYSADLTGAGLGCLLLFLSLEAFDAPTAVIFSALVASLASLSFLGESRSRLLRKFATGFMALLILVIFSNTIRAIQDKPFLRLRWVKGQLESAPLYEKWNSFSRIQIQGDKNQEVKPAGKGLSATYTPTTTIRQLQLLIDSGAESSLTGWGGDTNRLDYLKYDVINFPYLIRMPREVLVIGSGGGRDILAGLAFNVDSIVGVEINRNILDAVNNRFGEFTGHLDQDKRVRFVNDEARAYLTREKQTFDLIQAPLADTWAATVAGAYMLAENQLYTVEAWTAFLDKVRPDGILSFSRWHVKDAPWEIYRLISLAVAALERQGITQPRDHLLLVSHFPPSESVGIGNLMISKSPIKPADIDRAERLAASMRFTVDLSPRVAASSTLENLATGRPFEEFSENLPVDLSPPTDDSPFFFNMLRMRAIFDRAAWNQGPVAFHMKAVFVLGSLLVSALVLTLMFIVLPLILRVEQVRMHGCIPLFFFFSSIGMGFMLIEISQMQRLSLLLGHPTYALTTVLATLLIASGLGGWATQQIQNPAFIGVILFLVLLTVFGLVGFYSPHLIGKFQGASNLEKILASVGILAGLGLLMGTAFPLGMKVALVRSSSLAPWLFGINAAAGVLASILAVVISLSWGISLSYWAGVVCYLIALFAFVWACLSEGYSIVPRPEKIDSGSADAIEVEAQPVE